MTSTCRSGMKTSRIESPELDFFAFLVGHLYESFRYPPFFLISDTDSKMRLLKKALVKMG